MDSWVPRSPTMRAPAWPIFREVVDIDLDRPRDETGVEFNALRQRLLKLLEN